MKKPPFLKPGDTIGIAASASHFDRAEFLKGVENLKSLGFNIVFRDDIFHRERYLAGSDKRRSEELLEFLLNPNIKAVLFARGGYGLMRLLPELDKNRIDVPPKIVLGYSDLTSLLIYLNQKLGWVTFYGPVVAKDFSSHLNEKTRNFFHQAVTSLKPLGPFTFSETEIVKKGIAEGELTGGCLSLVVASLGTPFEIDTQNKILFLEDVNEKPYSIDRMLTQLLLAGKLNKVKGILFGDFANGGNKSHIREAIEDVLQGFQGPILYNFPAGHSEIKVTLPLGLQVKLDGNQGCLEYLEPALTP